MDEIVAEAFSRAIEENRRLGIGGGEAESRYPAPAAEPVVLREDADEQTGDS